MRQGVVISMAQVTGKEKKTLHKQEGKTDKEIWQAPSGRT